MRIVIDMQGAQTESRFRGIGRYTMAFAEAVIRNRGEHEVILVLSGMFPDTIEPIRAAFDGLISQERIRVWSAPSPTSEKSIGNDTRREMAELIREAFFATLQADVIHISSLFEGFVDDAVTSIGRFDRVTPVSVILYDLIPLLNPEHYLKPNPRYELYYRRKVEFLRSASLHLAISEFAREEAIKALGTAEDKAITISTAADRHIRPQRIGNDDASRIRLKYGITRPFVLYTGGADERKNLPRLIQAYAALPERLRTSYQMVFAGKMPSGNVSSLEDVARSEGLSCSELLFTGYVSEEELVQLYNLCELYVFPSWHEGFGLPALEAMVCGAPVIGANTSSLPEVIGLKEALFAPHDVKQISDKLSQALEDEAFRARLRNHGLNQSKRFSWDETARKAVAAWEKLAKGRAYGYLDRSIAYERLLASLAKPLAQAGKAELITVSDCLSKNGIAGVERQLLVDVSEFCHRDAATGVQRVVRSYLKRLLQSPPSGFRVEPVFATIDDGYRYARRFTLRFLEQDNSGDVVDSPVNWQRGDVFFALDMQHHVQLAHAAFFRQLASEGVLLKFLVHDLLPIQLAELFKDSNAKVLHEQWLAMVAATDGAICVSQATADAFSDWLVKQGVTKSRSFVTSSVHSGADFDGSKPSHGLPEDAEITLSTLAMRPSFLCVSTIEPRKRQQQVLEAVEQLWDEDIDVNLVLVGQEGWKTQEFSERLQAHPETGKRLFWLKGISDEYLGKVYSACTCLIAASLNEGFGLSLIEAAKHGLPIIARDIPVFREVAGEHAAYFSGESAKDLSITLNAWLEQYRNGEHQTSDGMPWSTWRQSTERLKSALVDDNYPRRQLMVDISELVQGDARTGIQRVVRNILWEWLRSPPEGCRVEPVYAVSGQPYRYARGFTANFLGAAEQGLADEPIDYAPGDVFLGIDLQPQVVRFQRKFYQNLRKQGVQVKFVVYDLLCVLMPQYFAPGAENGFLGWLEIVAESDGAVCISQTVANDLSRWIGDNAPPRQRPFSIDWFHLGADIEDSICVQSLELDDVASLGKLKSGRTFLMVGTLEPRKAHAQVLNAFEQLWKKGVDVTLALVGKQGWMVEGLVERLRTHPELDKRLFWFEGISDGYLEKVYEASTCLIAASYGEGFGLPLIESAQRKIPIIARDIAVFREVAEGCAYYFDNEDPSELSRTIQQWLELYEADKHPVSDNLNWLTWEQSAVELANILIGDSKSTTKLGYEAKDTS